MICCDRRSVSPQIGSGSVEHQKRRARHGCGVSARQVAAACNVPIACNVRPLGLNGLVTSSAASAVDLGGALNSRRSTCTVANMLLPASAPHCLGPSGGMRQ